MRGQTWTKILLFGSPALIAGLLGIYYLYTSRRKSLPSSSEEIVQRPACPVVESAPQTPLDTAIALKNRGNKNFKVGRYEKAVECYTEALEQCPVVAVTERATFYQNRAAALENLHQYSKAIEDCSAALELSPRYLKALNRRGHLYEKIEDFANCLIDKTASCMLERFQNGENVMGLDRVAKQLASKMAKKERPGIPRSLPSVAFITNYLSAFAWNPFTVEKTKLPTDSLSTSASDGAEKHTDEPANEVKDGLVIDLTSDTDGEPGGEEKKSKLKVVRLPESLSLAYESLDKALGFLEAGDYESSMKWASDAVKHFDAAPNIDLRKFERSTYGNREKPEAARARALLIDATYKALSGMAEDAKDQFIAIGQTMFADSMVRTNALIKAACLIMTLEQDSNSCMYTFHQAQTLSPDCPDVYLHRGQIHLLAEKLDDALSDLNKAVALDENFSVAHAQRLYTMYRRDLSSGKETKAESRLAEFRKLVEKYPDCLEALSLYAQVLSERGDYDECDRQFGKLVELAPTSGMAYAHRGLLQLRWKQDPVSAKKWLKKGVEVDPKCELALELLGQLSLERGDFEEALDWFNKAIQQAKTMTDLTHLISLREGVKAQMHVCRMYNISVAELFASLQQDFQQMAAAAAAMEQ